MADIVEFQEPKENLDGKWYVQSMTRDDYGYSKYLVIDKRSRPYVAEVLESHINLIYDTELQAYEELLFYYNYHGRKYPHKERLNGLYGAIGSNKSDNESQVMEFI